jgi:glutamate-ammonia-ligase adenylyltransferase
VQLLQLRHGRETGAIRYASTLEALEALRNEGLLSTRDAAVLSEAYRFCSRVRNRLFLQEGRVRDSLPTDTAEATRLARSLGYVRNPRTSLREDYRRITRRARRVTERRFFEDT